MEIEIGAPELTRALARSQGIAERKTTMPSLSHVLLEATADGLLHVSATDLDISVSSEHPCEVKKPGKATVPARQFFEVVRSLPEKQVSLRRSGNDWLEVKSGSAEFKLVGLPPDDFPALPRFEKVQLVEVQAADLLQMIDLTAFAVSTDETRYNLNGVFFEPFEGALRTVATDGHRLSLAERALPSALQVKKGVILPRKGLAELKKLLLETDPSETRLGFVENQAVVQRPGVTLVMRLVEGVFPDYRQVIPRAGDKRVTAGRERLLETLRRVSLLSSEKAHAVKLDLAPGRLRVLSQNPDLGEAREELPVTYEGPPLQIGFNGRYLIDVLSALACLEATAAQDVVLELADDLSPGVIRPAGESATRYTGVVMPMRI